MPLISTLANASARGYGAFGGVAASTTSYESIATTTVGAGGSSTITFSSIPSTYKHLQIRGLTFAATNPNSGVKTQFNSDTGSNYTQHALIGSGTTASAYGFASQTFIEGGYTGDASYGGAFVLDILDYTNTNKYKTTRSLTGNDANATGVRYIAFLSGLWMNTAAISTITITHSVGINFAQYSSFALYGIKG